MSPDEARRILGVSDTATQNEIKLAARRHAARTHPDRGKGSEAEFHKGQRAARTLQTNSRCGLCDGTGTVKKYRSAVVTEEPCPKCWGLTTRSEE